MKDEQLTDICKNCFHSRAKHLDTGLAKNWDCPVWTGANGGRHFELFVPRNIAATYEESKRVSSCKGFIGFRTKTKK